MSGGHTPGPWRTCNYVDVFPDDGDMRGRRHIAHCDMDNAPLASAEPSETTDLTYEECWANARLIAAAPELLSAVKLLREVCGEIPEPYAVRIDAAIAKAEGGS